MSVLHIARLPGRDGRLGVFLSMSALVLGGPLIRIGDAEFAAEILGWVSTLGAFDD